MGARRHPSESIKDEPVNEQTDADRQKRKSNIFNVVGRSRAELAMSSGMSLMSDSGWGRNRSSELLGYARLGYPSARYRGTLCPAAAALARSSLLTRVHG